LPRNKVDIVVLCKGLEELLPVALRRTTHDVAHLARGIAHCDQLAQSEACRRRSFELSRGVSLGCGSGHALCLQLPTTPI
jgi:hypothetical protein